MKKLLKLVSIISLGATPFMSVVACDNKDNTEVKMNEQVAKNLDLLEWFTSCFIESKCW
ncbi:hypothetical protein [Spiroplasma endosymbiont of Nebria brevicollis]|uniref:hypothetical protein n=1 Tax=Spiroplasma endosymbiont of Nebria brevicollis TaxID=3066284 RepID=UPI00313CD62F